MHSKSLSLLVALFLASSASAQVEWNHNPGSDAGPNVWGTVAPAFATCGSVLPLACGTLPDPLGTFTEVGRRQTPIDIDTTKVVAAMLPALAFQYKKAPLVVDNTGHVVEVPYPAGLGTLKVGSDAYDLLQFHFHTPSEHTLNAGSAAMEVHLVHRNPFNLDLAVVGILLRVGPTPNPLVESIFAAAPLAEGSVDTLTTFAASAILPATASTAYWTYTGSLTTPPCSEGVRWIVLKDPVFVSAASLLKFQQIVAAFPGYAGWPQNNRPVMPINGRTVLGR